MAEKNNPTTGTESDISKAQSQQQPPNQASQQQESGQQDNRQFSEAEQFETGHSADQPDALQSDTLSQQRTDVEGASFSKEKGEAEGGFVGAEGQQDTSSELVEDEEFDEGGESAPEGK